MVLWTVVVIVVLWLLLREHAPVDKIIVHGGNAPRSFAEKATDWFELAHLNFARIYPWILFGPYVIWLTSRCYLERGRLALNLAILLVGSALFAAATHAVNSRVSTGTARVVVFTSHNEAFFSNSAPKQIKMMKMEVAGASVGVGGRFLDRQEVISDGITNIIHTGGVWHSSGPPPPDWLSTNFLPRLEEAMRPSAVRASALALSPLATLLDLFAYSSLVGLTHAVHFYRRYRERETRTLMLESSLNKARLDTLQAQLQPHFLFNTLNAIATLLRRDPRAAEATLMSLSELLRLALSQSNNQEIPLRQELHFVERYMDIQKTRFGDRLKFEQQTDPSTLECLVPPLILQPLVENSIRHGIEPSGNPGTVKITAARQNGRLMLSVEDDGVGLQSAGSKPGIGLSNLRARFETLYGTNQTVDFRAGENGGAVVRMELPAREASPIRS